MIPKNFKQFNEMSIYDRLLYYGLILLFIISYIAIIFILI